MKFISRFTKRSAAIALLLATLAILILPQKGLASVLASQNFDDIASFEGAVYAGYGPGGVPSQTLSEAWSPTYYYHINNADGWTFQNGAEFVTNGLGNGAVLLNEGGDSGAASNTVPLATTTLTGLTAGQAYRVNFLYWGDNQPTQPYELTGYVGSALVYTQNGTDGAAASNPSGTAASFSFVATATSAALGFGQVQLSLGSPIVDNISVSSVPEPGSALFTLIAPLLLSCRRKCRSA